MTPTEYTEALELLLKEFIESVDDSVKEAKQERSREKEEYDPMYLIQTLAGSISFIRQKYERLQKKKNETTKLVIERSMDLRSIQCHTGFTKNE